MRPASITAAVSVLSLFAACGGPGPDATVPQAEPAGASSLDIGEHIVHYSAQVTAQLPAEIARLYDIVRSEDRAMLSVSVLAEATGTPVPATVSVKTVNLTGQLKTVNMRRIDEEEAIYYIGETPVANHETLIFDISVTPEGVEEPTEIRFKRQFYTDR
jgi:Domain of unknown function (DUF4426)